MASSRSDQYGAAPQSYGQFTGQPRRMNSMAIMALVSVFVFGPLAVIFGHVARGQIRRTGEEGAGIALGSLIIGYLETAVMILIIMLIVAASTSVG